MADLIVYKRKNCGRYVEQIGDEELIFVGQYTKLNDFLAYLNSCTDADMVYIVKRYSIEKRGLEMFQKYTFNKFKNKFTQSNYLNTKEEVLPNKINSQAFTLKSQHEKKNERKNSKK